MNKSYSRFALGCFVAATGFIAFGILFAFVSRRAPTAWLPAALIASTALVLSFAPKPHESAKTWLAHGGFVGALWIMSELGIQSQFRALSVGCIAIAILALVSLLLKANPGDRRVFWLASLAGFGGIVAFFSGASGGSGGMFDWFSQFGLSPEAADLIVKAVRKTIHFGFYGLFGLAAYHAFGSQRRFSAVLALAFVAVHAIFDEARQSSSPMRTGSAWDVLLDFVGAAAFLWFAARRSRD